MRFHAEHRFPAPPAAVAAVLLDPAFHQSLDLPDVGRPQLVDHADNGDEGMLVLRYEYVGQLDAVGRRLVGDRPLTWRQELRLRRGTGRGELRVAAEAGADRLQAVADIELVAEGGSSVRRVDGELTVRVPVVGRMAERRIVPGFLSRMDVEAAAVAERVRAGPAVS